MGCNWNIKQFKNEVPYEFRECSGEEQQFEVATPEGYFRTRLCWKHAFVWMTCKKWRLHPVYELAPKVIDIMTGTPGTRAH